MNPEEAGMAKPAPGEGQTAEEAFDVEQEDLLLVEIGGKQLLVRAKDVGEILRPTPMTPVPMGPEHLLGLANVHGQIVCIIDPSKVMKLPPINRRDNADARFVVLRHPKMHVGIWVDRVAALYRVNSADIPAPVEVDARDPIGGSMQIEGKRFDMLNINGLFQ